MSVLENILSAVVLYFLHFLQTGDGQRVLGEAASRLTAALDADNSGVLDVFEKGGDGNPPPGNNLFVPEVATGVSQTVHKNAKTQAQGRAQREAQAARERKRKGL